MRTIAIFVVTISLLAGELCLPCAVWGGPKLETEFRGKLFVLAIGIDKYEAPKIGLLFSAADATSSADSFEKRGKTLFTEIRKTVLLDSQATKINIEHSLDTIAREISADDTFVFVYAGFGTSHQDTRNRAASEPAREFYLFPYDGEFDSLERTAISGKELRSYFRRIRAKNELLILDSCDSSFGFEKLASSVIEQDQNVAELVDSSALFIGTDTIEPELGSLGHGVITAAVLDGLSERADYDGNGVISAREIESYLYGRMHELSVKYSHNILVHPRTIIRGRDFDLGYTDAKLEEMARTKRRSQDSSKETSGADQGEGNANVSRSSERIAPADNKTANMRQGTDYALLIANDNYEAKEAWRRLANPIADAEAISQRLIADYGFHPENVRLERNVTKRELLDVIRGYKRRAFNPEDQLFIFYAGHGTVDRDTCNKSLDSCDGYLVMTNSPADLTDETSEKFVSIDTLINKLIDQIPCPHIFVVIDACYAGQIWQWKGAQPVPTVAFDFTNQNGERSKRSVADLNFRFEPVVFNQTEPNQEKRMYSQISKSEYIKRKMKNRTRIIFTSGDKPVYDGKPGDHSPFARYFLDALSYGGAKYGVLTTGEIFLKVDALEPEPQRGTLSSSDGDFVFVRLDNH